MPKKYQHRRVGGNRAEVIEQFLSFLQLNSDGLREFHVAQARQDNFL